MPGGTTPRASGSKTAPEANSSMQNSPEMAAAAASPPPPGGGGTTAATSSQNKHLQSHADQTPPPAPNATGNANSPAKSGKSPKKVPIPEEVERRGPEAMRVHEIMQEFAQDWEKTQLKKREQAVKKTVPDTAIGQTALLATQATATAMQVFAPGSGSPAKRESLAQQTAKGKKGSGAGGAGAEKEKEPAYLKASLHKQQMQNTAAYKIFSKMYLMLFFWFIVATCWLIYSGQQYFNDTLPALRDIYFLHGGAARIEAAFDGFVQSRLLGTIEGIAHGAVMGMFEDPYDFFSLQLVVLAAMSSVPEASMLQMAYSYEGSPSSSSENQGGEVGTRTSSTVVAEPGQAQAAARTARRRKRQLRRKLDGHDGDDGDDESPGVEIDRVNSPLMSGGFRFRRIGEFEMMHFESDLYPSCIAEPLACNRNLSIIQAPWYGHLQKVDLSAEMLRKRNVFRFDEDILVSSSASASAAQQMMTAPGLMDGGIRSEAEAKALEASGGVYYDGHTGRMRMPFEVYSGISTGDDAPLPSPYYCPAGMILATELEAYKSAHGIGVSGAAASATASAAGGAANSAGTSAAGAPATSSAVRNDPNATIPFPPELCSYRDSYLALRAQVEKLQCDCSTCAAAVATNATTAGPAAAESGSPEAVCAALSAGAGAAGIFAGAAGGSAGSDAASNDTDSSSDATTATETTTGFACVALPTAETETTTPPPPFLSDQYDRGIYTEWEANLPERFSPGDTQVAMDSTHVMTVQTISLLFKIPIPESEHNTLQATLGGDPLAGSVDDLLLLSAEGSSASLRSRLRGLEDAVDRRRARGIVKRMLQHEGKSRRQRSGSAAPSVGSVEEDEYYALSAPPTTILEVRRDGSGDDTHQAAKGTRSTTATSATSSKKRTLQEAKSGVEHQEPALGTRQSRLAQRARLRVARKLLEKRKRRRRTRSAAGADRNDATGGPHLGGILNPSAPPAPPTSSFTAAELQEQLRRALSTTSSSAGPQDSEALMGLLQMVMQGRTPGLGAGTQAPPANKPLFLLGKITLEVDSLREQIVTDPHFLPEAYQGYIIAEDGSILVDLALKNTGVIEFMKIWEVDKFAGSLTPEMLAAAANDANARDHFFLDDIIVKRLRGKRLQNRFFVVFWADSGGLADTMVALAAIAGIVLGALPYTVVACLVAYLMYQEKVRTRTQKLQAQAVQEAHTTLTAVNAVTQGKTTSAPASAGGSQGSNSMANTRT